MTSSAVVVGLMSGTSADGISAAAVRFTGGDDGAMSAALLAFETTPYSPEQRARLLSAIERGSPREYCRLAFDLGEWLANAALAVMHRASMQARDVLLVASHGHTIWHEPGHSTWQVGEASVIAERTGVDVVSNFRVSDVAAGGQGAPLVPVADAMLFSSAREWRALQNLGGIGNVGVVPPRNSGEPLCAFDTGPGCVVIDAVVRALVPPMTFDRDGVLAHRGAAIEKVVDDALSAEFFQAAPPKSTGRELFDSAYVSRFIDACRVAMPAARTEDIVATAVELTARTIGDAYTRWVPRECAEVVLSGGGARNPALVDAIARALPGRTIRRFDELFFDGEAKEAVAFALMGYLHSLGRAGNVSSATGARGPRVLGALTRAPLISPP